MTQPDTSWQFPESPTPAVSSPGRGHHADTQPSPGLHLTDGDEGAARAFYLGYPLHLSPDEYCLLYALMQATAESPVCLDAASGLAKPRYIPTQALSDRMQAAYDRAHPLTDEERLHIFFDPHYKRPRMTYSPAHIALLVSRVNRKAGVMGERRLVLGKSHHGYALNPHL